jgi:hypothetical protein
MESLPAHVFKESFGPFVALLNEHKLKYSMQQVRAGIPMASSGIIEIVLSAAMWGALAAVIIAFIKSRTGRKIIITTKDGTVVHAEGLSQKEVEQVLLRAGSLTVIATGKEVDPQR